LSRRTETKLYCFRTLGMLAFRDGDVDRAREAFERVRELEGTDAGTSYALGHCAAAEGRWWRTLYRAFEAIDASDDPRDRAEFMRVGAVAMHRLGPSEAALAMLLGALERAPDHPWILQTIGEIYEREEMWLEALDVRRSLIDVLSDGLPGETTAATGLDDSPFHRLFQRFAVKFDITREDIERRRREIGERLRGEIGPVDRSGRRATSNGSSSIARLDLPRALHLLIVQLSAHDRNYQLLERAHSIWARARRGRHPGDLAPPLLAAATQWVVERLGWRVPTSPEVLSGVYEVDEDAIPAAARLIVGRHEIRFVSSSWPVGDLSPAEWQRLDDLQRTLLFGADVTDRGGRMLCS
ncbi:MAG: tetratricopeptide repeat protein, partial [Bradymonadaceae bacterium]